LEIGYPRKVEAQQLGALHQAKRIATKWQAEGKAIKQSFIKAGYSTNNPCPLVQ